MNWTPKHAHVTQIHPQNGSGQNDCFAASLGRYLFESGKVPLSQSPFTLINDIDIAMRGKPDLPDNPDTTLLQARAALFHYGLTSAWTANYEDAHSWPWAICLVDGRQLAPAQYPAGWFNPAPGANHFILWLPIGAGADNWFNDPLAFFNGQRDCQYDLASVQAAFGGAFLLPAIPEPAPVPAPPATWRVTKPGALKVASSHTDDRIAIDPNGKDVFLELGAQVIPIGPDVTTDDVWVPVRLPAPSPVHGFFPRKAIGRDDI